MIESDIEKENGMTLMRSNSIEQDHPLKEEV
jgi:hypothetical protein